MTSTKLKIMMARVTSTTMMMVPLLAANLPRMIHFCP